MLFLMIPISDLRTTAKERLADAKVLYRAGRYDGAIYVCGYAVEMALKVRICRHLRWPDLPDEDKEWKGRTNIKTHDFDQLYMFAGMPQTFKVRYQNEWDALTSWSPELRYRTNLSASQLDADKIIKAATKITRILCGR